MDTSPVVALIEEILERSVQAKSHAWLLCDCGRVIGLAQALLLLGLIDQKTHDDYLDQVTHIAALVELDVVAAE